VDLHRKTSLIAGSFFAFTFIFSIPALLFYDPVLNHVDYIVGAGADTRVAFGALFEIILVISNIATAVVLFPILKRQNESVALGYVASRIFESTIIAVGIISVLSVVTLRKDLAGVAGTDSGSLVIAGRSLVAVHDWTFLLGPAFCAGFGNGLLLGYLMYTSGLVPRRMALLGLIGGPIAFATATAVLFGAYEQQSGINFLFTVPEILWEASLTLWLLFKGFKPSPILAGDRHVATG
jgi:energy-converting hydrogenase Eha subunit A